MAFVLYHCMSARSFRPRWMLEELGLPYELEMLPFPPRSDPRYLDVNLLGTIPTFFDGEMRMTESSAICNYLAARHSPGQMNVEVDERAYGAYLTLTFPQTLIGLEGAFKPAVKACWKGCRIATASVGRWRRKRGLSWNKVCSTSLNCAVPSSRRRAQGMVSRVRSYPRLSCTGHFSQGWLETIHVAL